MGIAADFVLVLLAGLIGGILARLARLPLLVGYVAAGVAVGPHTAGPTVVQVHDIETLAEIGAALLLFSLGIEVSLRDLRSVGKVAFLGTGLLLLVLCGASLAAGPAILGISWNESIWLGSMISLSSTMVVLKSLAADGRMNTLASRVMIGMLVAQDLSVIPLMVVLPQLGQWNGLAGKLFSAAATAGLFLALMALAGKRVLPGLLKRLLAWGGRELFLIAAVATGVGTGFVAHHFGLSFALGAFVAGMVLSESEVSHDALRDVEPLRDIFGLLFFVSVGMLFEPAYVQQNPGKILIVVAVILLGKAILVGSVARAFGYVRHAPWIIGLGLAQIGEFSFVLARTGKDLGILAAETYNLALTATILTMALSPMVSRLALPLARRWEVKPASAEVC